MILVADMYGKGVRPKDDAEAMAQVKQLYADRSVLRARVGKALEVLKSAGRQRTAGHGTHRGDRLLLRRRDRTGTGAQRRRHRRRRHLPRRAVDVDCRRKRGAVKASLLVLNGADDTGHDARGHRRRSRRK